MKIAPDLRELVNQMDRYGDSDFERARSQMNALLAVVRIVLRQGPLVSTEMDEKLGRAIARLERASGRQP